MKYASYIIVGRFASLGSNPDCLWSQQHQKLIPSRSSRSCACFGALQIALKLNLSSCSPVNIILCASIPPLYFQQYKLKSCLCFVRWVPLKSCIKLCLFWSLRPHPSVLFFLMTLFRIFSKLMEIAEGWRVWLSGLSVNWGLLSTNICRFLCFTSCHFKYPFCLFQLSILHKAHFPLYKSNFSPLFSKT